MKVPILFRDMTSLMRWTSGRKTVLCIFTVVDCIKLLNIHV